MESMPNILDVALLVLLALFVLRGMVRGFVREVMGLVGIVAAVAAAFIFYEDLAQTLPKLTAHEAPWWPAVSFALILALVAGVLAYMGSMLSRLILSGPLSGIDRLLGGATGLAKGVLVAYVILNILLLALPFQAPASLKQSFVSPYVVQAGRYIVDLLPPDLTRRLQEEAGLVEPLAPATPSPQGSPEKK